jgi:hypothetical protein
MGIGGLKPSVSIMIKKWRLCFFQAGLATAREFNTFEQALAFKSTLDPSKILAPIVPIWIDKEGKVYDHGEG